MIQKAVNVKMTYLVAQAGAFFLFFLPNERVHFCELRF